MRKAQEKRQFFFSFASYRLNVNNNQTNFVSKRKIIAVINAETKKKTITTTAIKLIFPSSFLCFWLLFLLVLLKQSISFALFSLWERKGIYSTTQRKPTTLLCRHPTPNGFRRYRRSLAIFVFSWNRTNLSSPQSQLRAFNFSYYI